MFLEDQEFIEEDDDDGNDKVFFHLTSASACVVGVDVVFNGSKERNAIRKRRFKMVLNGVNVMIVFQALIMLKMQTL